MREWLITWPKVLLTCNNFDQILAAKKNINLELALVMWSLANLLRCPIVSAASYMTDQVSDLREASRKCVKVGFRAETQLKRWEIIAYTYFKQVWNILVFHFHTQTFYFQELRFKKPIRRMFQTGAFSIFLVNISKNSCRRSLKNVIF